jgi:hypothetical protein
MTILELYRRSYWRLVQAIGVAFVACAIIGSGITLAERIGHMGWGYYPWWTLLVMILQGVLGILAIRLGSAALKLSSN